MAPSHNSTRSRNASRILAMLLRLGRCFGPYAEAVADGAGKLGAVQGIEMEMPDAEAVERPALLDRDPRRASALEKAREGVGVEKELRDRARGAGIDLAAERVEIGRSTSTSAHRI